MIDNKVKTEIEFGEKPAVVLEWLKERLEENENKVVLIKGWCKRCSLCISFCPVKALDKDSEGYPVVINDKCISCGNCELICPDYAIVVSELKQKKSKKR